MIRHIVFLFISLFVISCTNEKKNNNDTSREISLVDTKSCSLENVISKMEIIELPRIEDAYIAGYKSFLAKNNLYIFEDKKGTLLVFGEDGRFISNSANKIGNGKEEYSILLAYTYNVSIIS